MSLSQFSTGNNGTRPIEAGDTPDIQDDFGVSILLKSSVTITKGDITQVFDGKLQEALVADIAKPLAPAVATETKVSGTTNTTIEARCITAGQMVALKNGSGGVIDVQEYAVVSANGVIVGRGTAAGVTSRKYARYVGKEGAVFTRKATADFDETLSVGIVPDQQLAASEVGWFTLVESAF